MTIATIPKTTRSRAGRKSDQERIQTRHANKILTTRLAEEQAQLEADIAENAKQAKPMRANTVGFRRVVLAGTGLIAIAAFAISFGAIFALSSWTGWDLWQLVLTPLLLDAGIVVFTFLSFIRLDKAESAKPTFIIAETLALLSVVAQVIHTFSTAPVTGTQLVVACVISALPPLILSVCSFYLGQTLFGRKRV